MFNGAESSDEGREWDREGFEVDGRLDGEEEEGGGAGREVEMGLTLA